MLHCSHDVDALIGAGTHTCAFCTLVGVAGSSPALNNPPPSLPDPFRSLTLFERRALQRVAWEEVESSLVVTQDVQDLWRAVVEDESGTREQAGASLSCLAPSLHTSSGCVPRLENAWVRGARGALTHLLRWAVR